MNKTIIININSIVFHIEEDAYDILRNYMIDIKKHFNNKEGSNEILEDIENRIAEMFSEKIQLGQKEVINSNDVDEIIGRMGRVNDFIEIEEDQQSSHTSKIDSSEATNDSTYTIKKLMRDTDDKILGGVCSGLGHYFGIEARWIRVLLILMVVLAGTGIMLYLILWIVLPKANTRADKMAMRGETPNLQNFKKSFEQEINQLNDNIANAESPLRKAIHDISNLVYRFFRLLGLFILIILTISFGITVLGLIIGFFAIALALMGVFENPMFPPLLLLGGAERYIALLFGFLAIVIPFIALFYLLIRFLFKLNPMNNFLSLGLFATWIISIIGIIYFVGIVNMDLKEDSTIKVETALIPQPVYYFEYNDVRVIDNTRNGKHNNIEIEGHKLSDFLRSNISIQFESCDSLAIPYIQYNYSAKGNTYQKAADRASKIKYEALQKEKSIYFNSNFSLSPKELERKQKVDINIYLPIGTEVYINEKLRYKLRNISYKGCTTKLSDKKNYTKWIMKNTGLDCLTKSVDKKKNEFNQ